MATTSNVVYVGSLNTRAVHTRSGVDIITDAPPDNQGLGASFSPTDLLATSLASCMLTVMGIKARDKAWDIDGTVAEVVKEMASGPRRVAAVRVRIVFKNAVLSDSERKLLEKTALTCPVAQSLHPDLEQDVSFVWPE